MGRDHERRRSRSRSPSGHRRHKERGSGGSKKHSERKTHSSRHRSDSRSPSRHRSSRRSPSPSSHRRHRDRSRSPSSRHNSHRSADGPAPINRERVEDIIGGLSYKNFDIDEQQKRLEQIMQDRRERIEKWRSQHKIEVGDDGNADKVNTTENDVGETDNEKKKWTLDDENEDDDEDDMDETAADNQQDLLDGLEKDGEEKMLPIPLRDKIKEEEEEDKIEKVVQSEHHEKDEVKNEANNTTVKEDSTPEVQMETDQSEQAVENNDEAEDDEDPLDAYMKGIQEEVKKYRSTTVKANKDKVTVVVVGVAKKKSEDRKRGELIEQNQDAMEYSSGDEVDGKDLDDLMSGGADGPKVKQKKLMTISKDDITYIPFRKAFYIEVPEIAKMTSEEVEAYKSEMEGIKTKGKGCPRPIKTWAQCGVSKKVLEVLKKNNYEKPTPIQCQAIPAIMSGRNLIGIAKTGSGKTLAYLLPMFRHILDQPPLESGDGPIAVVMIPTRELATQIYSECRKFAKPLGLRVVAVYGGTPISEQIGDLKPGAEIVVCTPGRMIDMLAANSGRVTNLRRCTYVVLDEADRMFDMGFEPQVMRIIDNIRPDRQTVMFSATFPRIMEALARRILDRPIEVQVGGRSVVCKDVEQTVVLIRDDDKFLKLLEILGKYSLQGSAIIFVDKQEHADMLLKELMHASYTCLALHGGIDQNDRDSTIADFKNGKVQCLVATSVAARGLDVKHCIVVVNYDCPNHYEDYVHRCGRTGRAGNKGYAYTFITPEQGRYSADVIKALEQSGNSVPEELQKLFEEFKKEQELLGKKVKSSSGFTGKGFKFDEAEAMQAAQVKKRQRAIAGMEDSDDEVDDEADDEKEKALLDSLTIVSKKVTMAGVPVGVAGKGQVSAADNMAGKTVNEKLEIARQRALNLSMAKGAAGASTPAAFGAAGHSQLVSTTAQAEAIMKGDGFSYSMGSIASAVNAKSLAEQRAEALHAKLNYVPKDYEYNEQGEIIKREDELASMAAPAASASVAANAGAPGAGLNTRYEEELEINDAPQQARWRVTSKEAIATISEFSEAGITVRGTYFPAGKEPGPGERKLYLAIEGMTEMAVAKAKAEIYRLIKDEMAKVKLSNNYLPGTTKGRYKVL